MFKIQNRNKSQKEGLGTIIDPMGNGISYPVKICFYDEATKEREAFILEEEQVIEISHQSQKTKLKYKLQEKFSGRWEDSTEYLRVLPKSFQPLKPSNIINFSGGLQATCKSNVVVDRYRSLWRDRTPWGVVSIYDKDGFVLESNRIVMGRQAYSVGGIRKPKKLLKGTYIYGDTPSPSYGHFITEGVARLWYAKKHPNIPIIWIRGKSLSVMQEKILKLLGIKNKSIFINETVELEECIFPFPSISLGDYALPGYFEFMGVVSPKAIIKGKKIFLSRGELDSAGRKETNSKELDELMKSYGFDIYYPEKYSLEEQLHEISTSEIVAGIEGSAFHTLVFYNKAPSTQFVVFGRHRMGRGVYEHIKNGMGLKYTTVNILDIECGNVLTARSDVVINFKKLENILDQTNGLEKEVAQFGVTALSEKNIKNYLDIVMDFPSKPNALQLKLQDLVFDFDENDIEKLKKKIGDIYSYVS